MEKKEQCDGKCLSCSVDQRTYCAAQMAYYNQAEIAEIKALLIRKDETLISKENVAEKPENSQEA